MIILIILGIVLTVVGYILYNKLETAAIFISALGCIMILITLGSWPINYYEGMQNIEEYNAVKITIKEFRKDEINRVERTALILQIIEINKKLAMSKYWNKTIFGDSIPDELADLPYLK